MNAIKQGIENYMNPKPEIEKLAKQRAQEMKSCPNFVEEKISFLKVNDKRIPELSGMIDKECGCVMSFKARQNIDKCKCWSE